MNRLFCTILLCSAFFLPTAHAEVTPEVERAIRQQISSTLSDLQITRITESPIPGLYQVLLGVDVVYATADGRYLLRGDLLDLQGRINRSDQVRENLRSVEFANIPDNEYIEFPASKDSGKVLYVYTDVRCSYCRRLHNNIGEINDLGITVRYLAFPVIGKQEDALRIMDNVWCSKDQKQALTQAKAGDTNIVAGKCNSPVRKHFRLGREMGVNGTPAMYLQDGTELPGYMEPQQILQQFRS